MNQEGHYFLKHIDENYKHESLLVSVQLRLSYQSLFSLQRASSLLRSMRERKCTNYVNQPALATYNSRLEASPLIARTSIFLRPFFGYYVSEQYERSAVFCTSSRARRKYSSDRESARLRVLDLTSQGVLSHALTAPP